MSKKLVEIFTDGACSGNPGPGGWGAILRYNGKEKEISGFALETTNNRMELIATIEALKLLKEPVIAKLYTDSIYVKDGITKWIKSWQKNNWKNSQKKDVKNQELWKELLQLCQIHDVEFIWVKGHNNHPENERADELARNAILEQKSNI